MRATPVLAVYLALFCLAAPAARSADIGSSAAEFILQVGAEAMAPQQEHDSAARSAAARMIALLHNFDFPGYGQLTLGSFWSTAVPAQKAEFASLEAGRLTRAYEGYLAKYLGGRISLLGERTISPDIAVVSTRLTDSAGATALRVDWLVASTGGSAPKIRDVIVAGVSMARTEAEEFYAALRANGNGLAGLLVALRAKVAAADSLAFHD